MSVGRQAHGAPAAGTDDSEAEQLASTPAAAMDVSTLTFNLRALSFLDKTLSWVKSKSTSFDISNSSPESTAGNGQQAQSAQLRSDEDLPIIFLDEVAWHDTFNDCWMVVCDYVYDCTNFMKNHPGGQDVLLEYAGRDATLAFVGTGHSKMAKKLLERYLIGELPVSERIFRTPNGIKVGDYD
ncbi:cytochrome b5 type B-like [Phymastichus coffea]|uniref:cytochrome b5 type B-like n=1 Tax=Phymastichus coffea TaxID=108790 RepID=UPI00273BAD31|nr:cytochrome b5 type B-like [Phymastichus coffea]